MTSTEVRTYALNDTPADTDYAGSPYDPGSCGEPVSRFADHAGYGSCTMATGHTGPQHVAVAVYESGKRVVGIAPRAEHVESAPEGTWKPGDVVCRTTEPRILVASVLHVSVDDDGRTRAWMAAREPDDATWRLVKSEVGTLVPFDPAMPPYAEPPSLAQIGEALASKAKVLDAAVRDARAERDMAQRDHEDFRRTVVETAMRYAKRHDWCSVVRAALQDMGLDVTQKFAVSVEVTATRTITVQVEADDASAAWQAVDRMDESALADAYEAHSGGSFSREVLNGGEWEWSSHDASTDVEEVGD